MRLLSLLLAAGTALSNSTTETVLGSVELPAGSLQANKVYQVRYSVRVTAQNSTDTLRVRLRVGPTTLTGTAVADSAAVDAAVDDVVVGAVDIVPRSGNPSTSGTVVAKGVATTLGAAGTVTARAAHAIVSSLDTKGATQRIEVTGVWSVANAGNSAQLESLEVYEVAG